VAVLLAYKYYDDPSARHAHSLTEHNGRHKRVRDAGPTTNGVAGPEAAYASVIAPRSAPVASFAYLASTPVV
jgi:hypothetical protein